MFNENYNDSIDSKTITERFKSDEMAIKNMITIVNSPNMRSIFTEEESRKYDSLEDIETLWSKGIKK